MCIYGSQKFHVLCIFKYLSINYFKMTNLFSFDCSYQEYSLLFRFEFETVS